MKTYDFIIVGAGIIGLTLAYKLKERYPNNSILILEKENSVGVHASGRNSGVLHSGIYYKSDTLKAKLCANGSKQMREFCEEYDLPLNKLGKIIVGHEGDKEQVKKLHRRALKNGAVTEVLGQDDLIKIEPQLSKDLTTGLYSPNTAVVDPVKILLQLVNLLEANAVKIKFSHALKEIDISKSVVYTNKEKYSYGCFFNVAGMFADKIAHACQVGLEYTILPFKGVYYKLKNNLNYSCNGLIYPVPDSRYPFLGIHITKSINGKIFIGPSAMPSLGRESYSGVKNSSFVDTAKVLGSIVNMYWNDHNDFRFLARHELKNSIKKNFIKEAKKLLPFISNADLDDNKKVGIRAQLYNKKENRLEMDFLVCRNKNTVHILNAVSPGFTSSFKFAEYVIN